MLQPIANAALPEAGIAALVANAAPAGVVASSPFADLLQLIAQGLTATPKGDAKTLLVELAAPAEGDEKGVLDPMAMLASAFLPAAVPVSNTPLAMQASPADEGMAPPAAMLGKKLPAAAADLAARGQPIAVSDADPTLPEMTHLAEEPLLDSMKAKSTIASEAIVAAKANPALTVESRVESPPVVNQDIIIRNASRDAEASQAPTRVSTHVNAPLASQAWRSELGDRLVWMIGRQSQSAEIILNPPALGSIEVRLNMNLAGNEAGAQFFSNNANVREALESAFPRLREMLAGAGINLGQASVSQESFQRDQTGTYADTSGSAFKEDTLSGAFSSEPVTRITARHAGLVDLYI